MTFRTSHKRTLAMALAGGALLLGFQNCAKPAAVSGAANSDSPVAGASDKPSITGRYAVTAWEGNLCYESVADQAACKFDYQTRDLTSLGYTVSVSDGGGFAVRAPDESAVVSGNLATSSLSDQQKTLFSFLDDSSEAITVDVTQDNSGASNPVSTTIRHAKFVTHDAQSGEVVVHTTHGNHVTLRPITP